MVTIPPTGHLPAPCSRLQIYEKKLYCTHPVKKSCPPPLPPPVPPTSSPSVFTPKFTPPSLPPLWVLSGSPLGPLWVPSGSPLGPLWVLSGSPLGPLWVPSGSPLPIFPLSTFHFPLSTFHSPLSKIISCNYKNLRIFAFLKDIVKHGYAFLSQCEREKA